jgi:hypothetical protein
MPAFARGGATAKKTTANTGGGFFEASLLDENTKLQLCQDLLADIGARNIRPPTSRGEIIHSCPLPFNSHRNGDQKPSASLNYKRLTFNCLGCGAQGGLLWFIASVKGEEMAGAWDWLGEQTGVGGHLLESQRYQEILEGIFNQKIQLPDPMPRYPDSALAPWTFPGIHPYMTDAPTPGARISCRGIPEENCRRFRIGYAERYPMGFVTDQESKPVLDAAGERIPLPPQERIIIPIFWEDQLVGWQARALEPGAEPKYKNSVGCPRDRVLYGWPGRGHDIVLVESPMSVLRHCHHQPMVASFGKQLTDTQLRVLQKARSVTVWFDPDPGGWQGTERIVAELSRYLPVRVVEWTYRKTDPADLDDATVAERIGAAVPWSLWKRPAWDDLRDWRG